MKKELIELKLEEEGLKENLICDCNKKYNESKYEELKYYAQLLNGLHKVDYIRTVRLYCYNCEASVTIKAKSINTKHV